MKKNVIQIKGLWDLGYILDKHIESSIYIGDDDSGNPLYETTRTEIGEAVYQLKYKNDFSKIDELANEVIELIQEKTLLTDVVVPMPPSKERVKQPVRELAKAVASKMAKQYSDNLLVKVSVTKQMKALITKEEKMEALSKSFRVNNNLLKFTDVLILDDIFDSGSSLEAACRVLRSYEKIHKIYVVALTKTRT